ncbi:MAG: hypothetical protein U9N61_06820 [Euryarchaeota archaeon]|nr:hypothetical protein [Euryarchaeota archaeon]
MGSEYATVSQVQIVPLVGRMDAYEYARRKALMLTHGRASEFMEQMFAFKKQYRTHFRANKSKRLGFDPHTIAGQTDVINTVKLRNYLVSIDANYLTGSEVTRSGTPTLDETRWYAATNGPTEYDTTIDATEVLEKDPWGDNYLVKTRSGVYTETKQCYMDDVVMLSPTQVEFTYRKDSDDSIMTTGTCESNAFDSDSLIIVYDVDDGYGVVKRYMIAEHGELPIYDAEEKDIMPIVPLKEKNKIMGVNPDTKEIEENTEAAAYFNIVQETRETKLDELMDDFIILLDGYGNVPPDPYDGGEYRVLQIKEPEFTGSDSAFKESLVGLYGREYETMLLGYSESVKGVNATADFLVAYKIRRDEYSDEVAAARDVYNNGTGVTYARSHEQFLRSLNLDYDDFQKTMGDEEVDSLYMTIGVDLMTEYEGGIEILFDYFKMFPQGNQSTAISDLEIVYNYTAEYGTHTARIVADLEYEFELEDMNGVTSTQTIFGEAIDRDKHERKLIKRGWIHEDTVKADYGYIMNKRSWVQKGWITEMKLVNRTTIPIEPGMADDKLVGRYASYMQTDVAEDPNGWDDDVTITYVIKLYYQRDETTVDYVYLHDFTQTYKFGGMGSEVSAINSPDKQDFEGFRIIPHVTALRGMQYKQFEAVYENSLIMLVYSYSRVKLEWYQSSWFRTILTIASIAAIVYTAGAATSLLGFVQSMIIGALTAYAVGEVAKSIGGEAGIILSVTAGMLISGGVGGATTTYSLLMASLNHMETALKAQTQVIISDMRDMIDGYDEKIKQVVEDQSLLAGYGTLDSDAIADIMEEWNSDVTDYFIMLENPNTRIYSQMDVVSEAKTIQPLLDAAWAPLDLDSMREIKY